MLFLWRTPWSQDIEQTTVLPLTQLFAAGNFPVINRSFSMFTATISILTQALILEFGVSGSTPLGSAREFWELVQWVLKSHTAPYPIDVSVSLELSITLRCTLTSSCKQAWTSCLPQELLHHPTINRLDTFYPMFGWETHVPVDFRDRVPGQVHDWVVEHWARLWVTLEGASEQVLTATDGWHHSLSVY